MFFQAMRHYKWYGLATLPIRIWIISQNVGHIFDIWLNSSSVATAAAEERSSSSSSERPRRAVAAAAAAIIKGRTESSKNRSPSFDVV